MSSNQMQTFPDNKGASSAILAVLHEARLAGVGSLIRTSLIKYLYLLDLHTAEEREGQTWTGAKWEFLHFGPYAATLAVELDLLVSTSRIDEQGGKSSTKDYSLYKLPDWSTAKSMEEIGIPRDARMEVSQYIRRFVNNLPALLDFVYFNTFPMRDARPGATLVFSGSKPNFRRDVRPIPLPVTDPSKAARIRYLMKRIAEAGAETQAIPTAVTLPLYDSIYLDTLADLEEETLAGSFTARLSFDSEG